MYMKINKENYQTSGQYYALSSGVFMPVCSLFYGP